MLKRSLHIIQEDTSSSFIHSLWSTSLEGATKSLFSEAPACLTGDCCSLAMVEAGMEGGSNRARGFDADVKLRSDLLSIPGNDRDEIFAEIC